MAGSQTEFAQTGMIVRTAAERPIIFARAFGDRQIVDAGDAQPHQSMFVKFPILVAVAAEPIAAIVVPFISEAHGDAIVAKCPDFLDQAIIELAIPFSCQERFDFCAALQELTAIAPPAVRRVGLRDACRITRVPGVFRQARLLRSGLGGERRQRRAAHGSYSCEGQAEIGRILTIFIQAYSVAMVTSVARRASAYPGLLRRDLPAESAPPGGMGIPKSRYGGAATARLPKSPAPPAQALSSTP